MTKIEDIASEMTAQEAILAILYLFDVPPTDDVPDDANVSLGSTSASNLRRAWAGMEFLATCLGVHTKEGEQVEPSVPQSVIERLLTESEGGAQKFLRTLSAEQMRLLRQFTISSHSN